MTSEVTNRALILVDIQNDFMPGGALAVANGNEVVPVANGLAPAFETIVATQDWHPADHGSFASQHAGKSPGELIDLHGLTQVLWPDHCVQDTAGARFVDGLEASITKVFPKGMDKTVDSYSGFFDNGHRHDTGLTEWLRERGVREVYVLGVATDYCVKFTALDAAAEGFTVHLVEDGCRGVELNEGDVAKAKDEMHAAGVHIVQSSEVTAG
ncbi:MAG: bifunctional nicotinamidase/pyrazinamidase [Myxococcota bacterium]